jgi:hypothetical protein
MSVIALLDEPELADELPVELVPAPGGLLELLELQAASRLAADSAAIAIVAVRVVRVVRVVARPEAARLRSANGTSWGPGGPLSVVSEDAV